MDAVDPPAPAEWLDERAAAHDFSGVVLVWRDGRQLFGHAAGFAHRGHRVRNTMDTRFACASVTKMVTAAVALRLVERGVVALDDAVIDVLPSQWRPNALTPQHTLRQLLQHTSGFANYHDDTDSTWASFTSCWDRIPPQRIRRTADLVPLLADLSLISEPGTSYRYNDAGYLIAGLVLEAATGSSFADLATAEVLEPAGMTRSLFASMDDEPDDLASAYYTDTNAPFEAWRTNLYGVPAMAMPDGGMVTTATDLARFVDALRVGRLVSPEHVDVMRTPNPLAPGIDSYGLGLELAVVDGVVTTLGHGGSDPGISARVAHYLADGTTIVVLCNLDRGAWAASQEVAARFGLR